MFKRAVATAPGKVTLFGEHAVVYGHPALVAAISRRVRVVVERLDEPKLVVSSSNLPIRGLNLELRGDEIRAAVDTRLALRLLSYVLEALEVVDQHLGVEEKPGLRITIDSDMPVSAGLGTSASITVATIAAYSALRGAKLKRETIARLGHMVEKRVQGAASPMDTAIATYGGLLVIEPGRSPPYRVLEAVSPPLVIGYTPREGTTAELVARVRMLRERYPDLVDMVMESIGRLTRRALDELLSGRLDSLGELMDMNHSLLRALGVSTKKLDDMVNAAKVAGALGAKLTGAGGGGSMIALCPEKLRSHVEASIRAVGGSIIEANTGGEGVKVESLG